MSEIRIRVGSVDVQLCGPGDRPLPVEVVEREIANARAFQFGGSRDLLPWRVHRCKFADEGRACGILRLFSGPRPSFDDEWVVSDTNREECQHGMDLRVAERVVALHNASLSCRSCLRDLDCALLDGHADLCVRGDGTVILRRRDPPVAAAPPPKPWVRGEMGSVSVGGTVTIAQVAGKFVERKPPPAVQAIRWTGQNLGDVSAWVLGAGVLEVPRGDSVKPHPEDPSVLVVWHEDDRMRVPSGSWLVEGADGVVRVHDATTFEKLYAPTAVEDSVSTRIVEGAPDAAESRSYDYSREALLRMTDEALKAHGRMVRGLARAAAAYEAGEGGDTLGGELWDDEMRSALALARELKIAPLSPPRSPHSIEGAESDMSKSGRLFAEAWNEKARLAMARATGISIGHAVAEVSEAIERGRLSLLRLWLDDVSTELTKWVRWACGVTCSAETNDLVASGEELRARIDVALGVVASTDVPAVNLATPTFPVSPAPGIDEVVVDACARVAYDVYRVAFVVDEPTPDFDALDPERHLHVLRAARAAVSGTTPEAFHAEWTSELARDGWVAGPELSEDAKTHPNLVPYGDLPDEQHLLDALFSAAATATFRELGRIESSFRRRSS
jgi:hypothetical protein